MTRSYVESHLSAAVCALFLACAPSLPATYVEQSEAARQAYGRGEYRQAAAHWRAAERAAPSRRYRDEAIYRRAMSLERAGDTRAARVLLSELAEQESGARTARARFDAAYLSIERGDVDAGMQQLHEALIEHPDSGPAIRALRTLLAHTRETGGDAAERRLIEQLEPKLAGSHVHQLLLYSRAKLVQRSASRDAAIDAYGALIDAYPYPHGLYWDESIILRAELLVEQGQPERAVASLRQMISHREASDFLGSYERRYGKAHYLMARIIRDELHDPRRARREFRTAARRYTTTLIRDDALWQAMICSRLLGEADEVCADARRLLDGFPESRFAGCAHRVCNEVPPKGTCRDYVMESWTAHTAPAATHDQR